MTGSGSNVVAGNDIGTDPTASLAIPNLYGVYIDQSSSSNLVGTSGQNGSIDNALGATWCPGTQTGASSLFTRRWTMWLPVIMSEPTPPAL